MSKELWIQAEEAFIEEHGREPTEEEMREAYIDQVSSLIDQAKEIRKYGE